MDINRFSADIKDFFQLPVFRIRGQQPGDAQYRSRWMPGAGIVWPVVEPLLRGVELVKK